jgi:hypothetical protein
MIKHIALFKLKENHNGLNKQNIISEIIKNVHGLRENIKEIKHIEVAPNYPDNKAIFSAADLAVYVEFETDNDFELYFNHPLHKAAAAYAVSVSEQVSGISYKI